LQRRLSHPIGEVLTTMKQPLPKTHLLDPMATIKMVKSAKRTLWMLPLVDKYLMNGKQEE